jgi:hypothetical protein
MACLLIIGKHLGEDGGSRVSQAHASRVSRMGGIHPIAKRRRAPGKQGACTILLQTAPTHALGDEITFIFGHHATNLQEQLVVRILAHRAVSKFDLAAAFFKFFDQQHLMDVFAGQTIWCGDENEIKIRLGYLIAQPI